MTQTAQIDFIQTRTEDLATAEGRLALIVPGAGALPKGLSRGLREQISRARGSAAWTQLADGEALEIGYPAGMAAESLILVKLSPRADALVARKAGAAIAQRAKGTALTVLSGKHARADQIALGLALRHYVFDAYKTRKADAATGAEGAGIAPARSLSGGAETARMAQPALAGAGQGTPEDAANEGLLNVRFMHDDPESVARAAEAGMALVEGVFFTRDLISEPANVLTTTDFADRLAAMEEIGLEVEILEEDELAALGMRALLAVGQGSESPSKVAVMRWHGGGDEAPLALVGKGVVFDTGGISIKPAAGMEEMTMDMGGAGVVAGVMRTLALRRAKANVVGLVGLVENMPDGRAQRPGDIVKSMKGDTIEVINTDAEGRLVLADVLWYAQQRFKPRAVIDLATLTGAVIIALGHDHAGIFANDDKLAGQILDAAKAEGEGAWRLPLAPAYDKLIDSRLADMKNTGGRPAGSITAAQFLQRFVVDGTPWAHIDIAGVALPPSATDLAPKGASGWGVMTLDRLIRDRFEG